MQLCKGLLFWIILPNWKGKIAQTDFLWWNLNSLKKETIHPTHPYNFCQRFFFVHTNLKPWIAHNFFAWGRMQNIFTSSSAHFKTKIPMFASTYTFIPPFWYFYECGCETHFQTNFHKRATCWGGTSTIMLIFACK